MGPVIRPSIIVPVKKENVKVEPCNGASGSNEFLYVESKRARLDREKEERKRKLEVQLDFAPEDIALATVPGLDFDPRPGPLTWRSSDLNQSSRRGRRML